MACLPQPTSSMLAECQLLALTQSMHAHNPRCLALVEVHNGGGEQWIGTLQPGPNPKPEHYPLDCCNWGVYLRFHGAKGKVGVRCEKIAFSRLASS